MNLNWTPKPSWTTSRTVFPYVLVSHSGSTAGSWTPGLWSCITWKVMATNKRETAMPSREDSRRGRRPTLSTSASPTTSPHRPTLIMPVTTHMAPVRPASPVMVTMVVLYSLPRECGYCTDSNSNAPIIDWWRSHAATQANKKNKTNKRKHWISQTAAQENTTDNRQPHVRTEVVYKLLSSIKNKLRYIRKWTEVANFWLL